MHYMKGVYINSFTPSVLVTLFPRVQQKHNVACPGTCCPDAVRRSRTEPNVWGRFTGKIFILVNIWSKIIVPQTSTMYTLAGDEYKCKNKVNA
jgi:hypothetical protein